MSDIEGLLFLYGAGLLCIIHGLAFHLDYSRWIIVFWSARSGMVYGTIPVGISLILTGIAIQFGLPVWLDQELALMLIIMPWPILAYVFALTMPQFLTPWWFRYLRENYDNRFIAHTLMADAAKDYKGWMERTKTIEGLVSWADDIASRTTIDGKPVEKLPPKARAPWRLPALRSTDLKENDLD